MEKAYVLRAHHGLCLCFFRGEGYSSAFVRNMAEVKRKLEQNPMVRITGQADAVCGGCPHCEEGRCAAGDKVAEYDRQVMRRCGVTEGERLPFLEFQQRIRREILDPGKRKDICGDCQWDSLCGE